MERHCNAETSIGRVCVQLASPDFKFMSGETLTLEGGMGQRQYDYNCIFCHRTPILYRFLLTVRHRGSLL